MSLGGFLTLTSVLLGVLVVTPPLGNFIHAAMEGRRTWLTPIVGPVERVIYRLARIEPTEEQDWKTYATSLVVFTIASIAALYLFQRFQGVLPLNPTGAQAVAPELAFNTAVSFSTTTDWQNYAGETGVSHLFASLIIGTVVIVGALSYFAALRSGRSRNSSSCTWDRRCHDQGV